MERPGSQVYLSEERTYAASCSRDFSRPPAGESAPLTPEVAIVQHGVYRMGSSKHCLAALGQQRPILVAE